MLGPQNSFAAQSAFDPQGRAPVPADAGAVAGFGHVSATVDGSTQFPFKMQQTCFAAHRRPPHGTPLMSAGVPAAPAVPAPDVPDVPVTPATPAAPTGASTGRSSGMRPHDATSNHAKKVGTTSREIDERSWRMPNDTKPVHACRWSLR